MYFHYEPGYDARDLVVQLRQEKGIAKDIGLSDRSNFLGLMENLVCHFHGIRKVDQSLGPRSRMPSEVIKMKMSNEAHKLLSYLNDPPRQRVDQRNEKEECTKAARGKVYKYPCSVSNTNY